MLSLSKPLIWNWNCSPFCLLLTTVRMCPLCHEEGWCKMRVMSQCPVSHSLSGLGQYLVRPTQGSHLLLSLCHSQSLSGHHLVLISDHTLFITKWITRVVSAVLALNDSYLSHSQLVHKYLIAGGLFPPETRGSVIARVWAGTSDSAIVCIAHSKSDWGCLHRRLMFKTLESPEKQKNALFFARVPQINNLSK